MPSSNNHSPLPLNGSSALSGDLVLDAGEVEGWHLHLTADSCLGSCWIPRCWLPLNRRLCFCFQVDDLVNFRPEKTFDLVVMDPPWENKHVKRVNVRGKGYDVLSTDSMASLLTEFFTGSHFCRTNGILLTWVSNSGKQQEAVLDWARRWKLDLRAKWFWLKVIYSNIYSALQRKRASLFFDCLKLSDSL